MRWNELERSRAGADLRHAAAMALIGMTILCGPRSADACIGPPPPPFCAKTLVWSHAGPPVLLLPGGGTFSLRGLLVFKLLDFPAGLGSCPLGPFDATVTVTVSCSPMGDGGGTITVPVSTGFNEITVPVTLPPGPPRACTVVGTATMTLSDGMGLEASSDSVLCVGEPAPGQPGVPRLDLSLLGPPERAIARVHPGDQASHRYRLVNNDSSETFVGTLGVGMENTSRLPLVTGPMPSGTGPFSISDPVQGDNFPIGFEEDLFMGCVVLPTDPTDPQLSTLERDIELEPGEAMEISVYSRPWGACADGSCSRGTVVLDGSFSGGDPGLACGGFVTAADRDVAPSFLWDDGGESADAVPSGMDGIRLSGRPRPGDDPGEVDVEPRDVEIMLDGQNVLAPPLLIPDLLDDERGRIQLQIPGPFPLDGFFEVGIELDVLPLPPLGLDMIDLRIVPEAPTGFFDIAPAIMTLSAIDGPQSEPAHFTMPIQWSATGVVDNGARRPVVFEEVSFERREDGTGLRARLGGTVRPGPGNRLDALEIAIDLRGFFSPEPPGFAIFEDAFESGNVSRWSITVP